MSIFDTGEFSDKPSREWLIENGFVEIDEELEYIKYVRLSDRRFIFEPIYFEYRYQTGELLIYTHGFTRWNFKSEVKTNVSKFDINVYLSDDYLITKFSDS
jgi:hypothetical protein